MPETQTTTASTTTKIRAVETTGNLVDDILLWLEKNFTLAAGLLAGIVAVALGWIAFERISASAERNAYSKLDRAIAIYHRPVGSEGSGTASLEDLQKNAVATADSKRFDSNKVKAGVVMKELESAPSKPSSKGPDLVGSFYLGFARTDAGDTEQAASTFNDIQNAKPVWEPLGRLAAYNRAVALSEAGKFEEAGGAFRAAAKDASDGILKNQALLQAAHNFRAAGKADEARSALEDLKDMDAEYAEQHGVQFFLDQLSATGK